MKNVIFIGMPAVGKSTVGVVVAKRLGYDFIDTDLLIQKQENRLLSEIIAEQGVDEFLKIENQVNRDLEAECAVSRREEVLSIVKKQCSISKKSEPLFI